MSDTEGNHDGHQTKGGLATLMANGKRLHLKGEYKKAIDSYTLALTAKPDEKSCFAGRAKCYLKMGQPENALKDAEASLALDKTYCEGLYQKAEALYYMGEFEFAWVVYYRGQKLRPQKQEFRLGVQKAQEAIENCVGNPSSVKLEIKGDLSVFQKDEEKAQPITSIWDLTKEKKKQRQKTPKNEKVTRQLLGEFYSDKKFLENLLKNEGLVKGQTKTGEQLQQVIQGCLTSLDSCSEVWIQEKPICTQERERKPTPRKSSKSRHGAASDPAQFLLKSLDDIDAALTSGDAEGSLKKAEEVLRFVQGWSEREMPDKNEVLGSLHSCIGNALIELGDMEKALEHHQKDLELAQQCELPDAMSRALDNIGLVYAQTGQFSQAIEFWKKKIPMLSSALERAWLFHEIGRCYLELGQYQEAQDCGVRSAAAADDIADVKWQRNANVLVAQSELKQGNFESCVSFFERALNFARAEDDPAIKDAIQKALDEAKQNLSQ